ncbi:MFS transporter [Roseiterribacter gracilis]|uniref:MFS transporter n=1 Tax=Roseiterribacter gracilis TaxID=2812848 RepID=A0A8S8X5P6_9PROT|nr:MFS transporter [Rhodospirillales bacterium TMPK1]
MNARLGFVALLALGIGAAAPSIVFPGVLGALVASGRYEGATAAWVISGELAGMMVAAALVAWLGARVAFRRVAAISVVAFLVLDVASAALPSLSLLVTLRVLAGAGEGAAIASMAAMAASLTSAARYFAVSVACNLAASAVLLRVFPRSMAYGTGGIFLLLAVVALPSLLLLRALPVPVAATAAAAPRLQISRGVVLACLCTLFFFAAISTVWSFVTLAATKAGLSFDQSSQVLALATVAGIATGLGVSWLTTRVPRQAALLVGTIGLAVVIAVFADGVTATSFAPITMLLMIAYVFTLPFYFGTIAALDRSGRVMAFAIALQFAGLASGPAVAAVILESSGQLARVFWFACALCVAAGALAIGSGAAKDLAKH